MNAHVKKLIKTLCFTVVVYNVLPATVSSDISFCIADIKYYEHGFKICEFGMARASDFKGKDAEIWELFWKYLKNKQRPFYHVGHPFYLSMKEFQDIRNYKAFKEMGGIYVPTLKEFQKRACKKYQDVSISQGDYNTILYKFNLSKNDKRFLKEHPFILAMDSATSYYFSNKVHTRKVLIESGLQAYSPKYKVVKNRKCLNRDVLFEAQKEAQIIIDKFQCDWFVIKPPYASMGRGVTIVEKKQLATTLQAIFMQQEEYKNYAKYKSFLVEEFVSSKAIIHNNKKYDATARLVFALSCDKGELSVSVLDGYWKIPVQDLDSMATLTLKHKSSSIKNNSVRVDMEQADYESLKKQFEDFIIKLYAYILTKAHND